MASETVFNYEIQWFDPKRTIWVTKLEVSTKHHSNFSLVHENNPFDLQGWCFQPKDISEKFLYNDCKIRIVELLKNKEDCKRFLSQQGRTYSFLIFANHQKVSVKCHVGLEMIPDVDKELEFSVVIEDDSPLDLSVLSSPTTRPSKKHFFDD